MYKDSYIEQVVYFLGDRLIWVNRTNVESMSLEEVNAVLDMAPDGSSLVISRNKDQQKEVGKKENLKNFITATKHHPDLTRTRHEYKMSGNIKSMFSFFLLETKKDQPKEAQLIPNVLRSEEPYLFGVTYLT